MRSSNRKRFSIFTGFFFLATALFLSEFGTRLFQCAFNDVPFFDPARPRVAFLDHGVPFYALGADKIQTRFEETFSLKKDPNSFRIVLFGGSTLENYTLFRDTGKTLSQTITAALGSESRNVEILNVAYGGYTTAHSLVLLSLHVQSWEPDLYLYSHNFNDLTVMYYPDLVPDYSNMLTLPYFTQGRFPNLFTHFLNQFRLTRQLARKIPTTIRFSEEKATQSKTLGNFIKEILNPS